MKHLLFLVLLLPLLCIGQVKLYTKSDLTIRSGSLNINGDWYNGDSLSNVFIYNAGSVTLTQSLRNRSKNTLFANDTLGTFTLISGINHLYSDTALKVHQMGVEDRANAILHGDIRVHGNISLDSGSINLNGHIIDLYRHGAIESERFSNLITGDSGFVQLEIPGWTSPQLSNNIRGIGLFVQAGTANFGTTVIKRFHYPLHSVADTSVNRGFEINAKYSNQPSVVKIKFFPNHDLKNTIISDLAIYSSNNSGQTWIKQPTTIDSVKHLATSLLTTPIHHSLLTLAASTCQNVPVSGVSDSLFVCQDDSILTGIHPNYFALWSNNSTGDSIYLSKSGTYWVNIRDSAGCETTDSFVVVIDSISQPGFTSNNQCTLDTVTFTPTHQYAYGNLNYRWDFGDSLSSTDTSNIKTPSYSFSSGSYPVSVKVTTPHFCTDSFTKFIIIHPSPIARFGHIGICENEQTLFTDSSSSSGSSIIQHLWKFGDGDSSSMKNVQHHYQDTGDYAVTLWIQTNTGCVDSTTRHITIHPTPLLKNSYTGHCLHDTIKFKYQGDTLNQFDWDFGDGNKSTIQSPSHLYPAHGPYNVQLIGNGINGCIDTLIKSIMIDSIPQEPWYVASSGTCGDSLLLDAKNPGSNYFWSTFNKTRKTWVSQNGQVNVTITYPNGCEIEDSIYISVNTPLAVQLGSDTSVCHSLTLNAGFPGATYQWSTGDTTQSLTINQTGNYRVQVLDQNGCVGADTIHIVVHTLPQINLGADTTICNDIHMYLYAPPQYSAHWNTGDTSSAILTNQSGKYWCRVQNSHLCTNSDTIKITYNEKPKRAFSKFIDMCGRDTILLKTIPGALSSAWYDDGGLLGTGPFQPINDTGLIYLQYQDSSGCTYTDTTYLTETHSKVQASFLVTSSTKTGDTLKFVNVSYSLKTPLNYQWTFGEGNTSHQAHPNHIYYLAGTYPVQLRVSNGICADSIAKRIFINSYKRDSLNFEAEDSSISTLSIAHSLLYPNPNSGSFTLNIEFTDDTRGTLYVIDMNGRLVFHQSFSGNKINKNIVLPTLHSGNYICVIKARKLIYPIKFIVR